ncbi:MAG: septal ring lytic transglycosylase RlpA family protein [Nitrospirae bacterium]|nr:septal ring lytic transglycosylase RlpA family protein [Nitrospirota bacterium]
MSPNVRFYKKWWLICGLSLLATACTCLPKGKADLDVGMKQRGIASWYGSDFHGWLTANGEIYNMRAMTGAHRTLPLGTVVRVTNVKNGKQVRVRINDRGPYVSGRIIDLSYAAAQKLGMMEDGIAAVSLEVVGSHGAQLMTAEDRSVTALTSIESNPERFAQGSEVQDVHSLTLFPGDFMRERRTRRVADFMAAEHMVYRVSLSI